MAKSSSVPTDSEISTRSIWGWLRPYLAALDEMFNQRWSYWLSALEQGVLPTAPIPQIDWLGAGHAEPKKNLETCINYGRHRPGWQTFNLFVEWLLYGFGSPSVQERPIQIEDDMNAFWYKTFNLGLFLKYPHDYLGEYAAELYNSGRHNPTGYFPTPMHVSVLMASMLFAEQDQTASVCDPCVGSGRLLMAASNYSLNLYGMDIDANILKVCHANMWMYVPWCVARPPLEGLQPSLLEQEQPASTIAPVQQITVDVQRTLLKSAKQMDLFTGIDTPDITPIVS